MQRAQLLLFEPKSRPVRRSQLLGCRNAGKVKIDCILDTVPPEDGREDALPVYHGVTAKIMSQNNPSSYIYISSTSVFPRSSAQKAAVFDETARPAPDTKRGKIRLRQEKQIESIYPQAKILRSAGIYGPGRSLLNQIQAKNFSRTRLGNRFVSRIHVHDLLRLAFALGQNQSSPRLVHAVDEKTVPYKKVFSFLESELGVSIPDSWHGPHAPIKGRIIKSLYAKSLLKGKYTFPDYREGFRNIRRSIL